MGIPKPTLHSLLHKLVLAKSNVTTSPKTSPEQRTSKVEENNKGQIVLPLFAVGGWTNARQGFGSSLTFFLSFLCQDKKGKKKKLSPSKITYESLLAMGIPKPTLHGLLHKLLLAKSNVTKHTYHPSTKQLSANSNSEKEPTAQSTFSSLTCAGEYPLNKVLDLPNPTQASTNKTSEIEPTAQSTFSSLRFAGRVHSAVKIKKQLLNMVTAVGCEMARQNARRVRVCLDFFSFFFVSRQKRKRFTNTDKYLKKNELKGSKEKLGPSEITYESLLALGIPMPTLHRIMHQMFVGNLSMNNHRNFPRHPYRIWHYYKNLQLKNRLSTYTPSNNSLSLLKTNFAKKPKNPV